MRALIVTNMWPTQRRPALGVFVRDQVEALRRAGDEVEIDVHAFAPGGAGGYLSAAGRLAGRGGRYDVVHAHFGLTAWPALAPRARARVVTLHGTDLHHPRSRALTLAALPFYDLTATVSKPLAARVPRWAPRGEVATLPCGVDLHRFRPLDRAQARARLGLRSNTRYALLAADPARPEKRADRAAEVASAGGATLLTLGAVAPAEMPLYVNAADVVLVPSERESFGLAALEALACDVPVLATPVGVAPEALAGLPGALCAPYDAAVWTAALRARLESPDPRLDGGRARAEPYGSDAMARRVLDAWRGLLEPA